MESLEARRVLATLFWQGDAANTNWGTAGNWADDLAGTDTGALPANGDTLVFNTNTTGFASFTANNNLAGLTGIDIQIVDDSGAGDFTIGGVSAVSLSGSGITNGGTTVGTTTINTPLLLGAPATITQNSGLLRVGGTINNNGNLLTVSESGGISQFTGVISGAGGLTVNGGATLAANNTYGGTTTVMSGSLAVGTNGALGDTTQPTVVQPGAVLDLQVTNYTDAEPVTLAGGSLRATNSGASSFAGNIALTADSTLAGFVAADQLTLSGVISGGFGVNIAGSGTTILSGNHTYTGSTSVDSGTLQLDGSTAAASAVTVNAGSTLSGTGNAMGSVTVQNGGTISPGTSPGIINTGDFDAMDGSNYDIEINNPGNVAGTDFDQINVTGSVTIGNLNFNLMGTEVPSTGDQYVIINNDGVDPVIIGANAPAQGSIVGQLGGQNLRINYNGGDGNDVALFSGLNNIIITADNLAVGTGGDGTADSFAITNVGNNVVVSVNGTPVSTTPIATTGSIGIKGSTDNDTLTINNSNGLIVSRVTFDGDGDRLDPTNFSTAFPVPVGAGFDTLQVIGNTVANTIYNPGVTPDAGAVFQQAGGALIQSVQFMGLEPVQIVGGGAGASISVGAQLALAGFPAALNASNTINYTSGPNSNAGVFAGLNSGLVSVDGFETVEFSSFGSLIINAGAGDDKINLNYQAPAVVAPTNLASIGVLGGDPTASDTLVINNNLGTADFSTLRPGLPAGALPALLVPAFPALPLGTGSGSVINTVVGGGTAQPNVFYATTEHLSMVGQSVDGDPLQIGGTAGNDSLEYAPGANLSEGTITGALDTNNATGVGPFSLPRVSYSGLALPAPGAGAAVAVPIVGLGLGINDDAGSQGGADTLIVNGSSQNDVIQVVDDGVYLNMGGENPLVTPFPAPLPIGNVLGTSAAGATSASQIVINAGDGDDNTTVTSAQFAGITYDFNGGDPSGGSDVLNLIDPALAAASNQTVGIAPDLIDPTQQDIAGFAASATPIDVTGQELITYTGALNAAGARDDTLFVSPGLDNDKVRVENQSAPGTPPPPTGTASVTSQTMPVIHFTGLSLFTVGSGIPGANPGVTEATFVTQNLDPATAYGLNGGSEDILIIEGADTFPDNFVVHNGFALGAAGGTSVVTDMSTAPGPVVAVAMLFGGAAAPAFIPGEIRVKTMGGDDVVTIDAGGGGATAGAVFAAAFPAATVVPTDLVDTRIVYDGGTGGDVLNVVSGAAGPATAVLNEVYTPGPDPTSGKIDYGTAIAGANLAGTTLTGTMQVEFKNLQPVQSSIVANVLSVNGNNADNTINYNVGPNHLTVNPPFNPAGALGSGIVSVDNHETIEFANKTAVQINGLAGDDTIRLGNAAAAVPTGLTLVTVNGGSGDDVVDGSGNGAITPQALFGNAGNDTITGGGAGDLLLGGIGNDTLVDSAGNDYFDGGNNGQAAIPAGIGFPALPAGLVFAPAVIDPIALNSGVDSVVVRGTGLSDVLNVIQNAPSAVSGSGYPLAVVNSAGGGGIPAATADVLATVAANAVPNVAASRSSIEEVRIEAGAGNDQIAVAHADVYSGGAGTPQQMVRFDVRGNAPDASDRLVVRDLGLGDLVLVRQSPSERSGRVTLAPAVNTTTLAGFNGDIVYSGIENVDVSPINPFTGATGGDGLGRVVVFQADPFEANDALPVATNIGDLTTIHRNPTIDPGNFAPFFGPNADEDWYVFNARRAGTAKLDLLFNAIGPLANGRAGLPGGGALVVGVYNAAGVLIAGGSPLTNAGGTPIGQSVQFAAIANTSYFVRVTGAPLTVPPAASASAAINTYNLSLTANIDNLGPQVIDPDGPGFPAQAIQIVDNPFFNLFTNKPASGPAGPTPPINGLTINFRDPITSTQVGISAGATLGALDAATALNPGSYSIVGEVNGAVPVTSVAFAHPSTTPSAVGVVLAAGPNSTTSFNIGAGLNPPPAGANANASPIVGQTIQWVSGPNTGLTARIVSYNNGTGVASVALPFPAAAATGNGFIIMPIPDVVSPLTLLQGVTVAPGYVTPGVNGAGAFSGDVNIAANPPAAYVGQSVQITDNSLNTAFLGVEQRTIVGVTAGGAFVFNQPFSGNVPAGTTFNIVGTAASAQGVVAAAATATSLAGIATPANNFGIGSIAGAALSAVNGFYVGQALTFTNGPAAGQSRVISAYNAGSGTLTFTQGFTSLPRVGDHFLIGPATNPPIQGGAAGAGTTATTIIGTAAVVPAAGASVGGLSTTPGDYVGQLLVITSGPLTGETQLINSYNGAGTLTVENPFSAAPAGATFVITPVNQSAVTLSFGGPLPDDRYTLTIEDSIRDYAGNALDGENNGIFPSGNGVSGGDFVTSFSVDSSAELAVWSGGSVYIDTNGNFTFDPNSGSSANRDVVHTLGFTTDHIIAGNFANMGVADGFDKLAAYGQTGSGSTAAFRWLIDTTNDGVPDVVAPTGNLVGIPVAGNFNAAAGDEVGLFTGSAWIFDATTADFNLGNETVVPSNMRGIPFVGDFDADGLDDLGTYNSVNNTFNLSLSTAGGGPAGVAVGPNTTTTFTLNNGLPFIGVRSRPVAGDIDSDGIDDIGLWVPDRSGVFPTEAAEWYILASGGAPLTSRIIGAPGVINFTPTPFGNDRFAQFGDEFGIPLLGNFDPPPPGSSPASPVSPPAPVDAPVQVDTPAPVDAPAPENDQPQTTDPPPTPPSPAAPPSQSSNEDPIVVAGFGTLTVQQGSAIPEFNLNRVFSDDGELFFSVAENSNPDLVSASIQNGYLQVTAVANAGGMAKINVEARDAAGKTVENSLELHVVPTPGSPVIAPTSELPPNDPVVVDPEPVTNEPPVGQATTNISLFDNSGETTVDLTTKFTDADDTQLEYQLAANSNPGLLAVTLVGDQLTLNPSDDSVGTTIITVRATDSVGGQATHAIVVRVASSNRAPIASGAVHEITVDEDADTRRIELTELLSDPDGDELQFRIRNSNHSLVSPQLFDSALSLMFNAGETGRASIEVTAEDPEGLQAQIELRIEVEERAEPVHVAPSDPVIPPEQVPTKSNESATDEPPSETPASETPAEIDQPDPPPVQRLSLRSFLAR